MYIEVRGGVVVAAYSDENNRLIVIDHDRPSGEEVMNFVIDPVDTMPGQIADLCKSAG